MSCAPALPRNALNSGNHRANTMTLRHITDAPAAPAIIVAGLGNAFMGDDGVGVQVANALAQDDLAGVTVYDIGTAIWHLMDLLQPDAWLLAIDAVDMGCAPGAISLLDATDVWSMRRHAGAHGVGLFEVLALMEPHSRPAHIAVVAIQPETVAPGLALSPAVAAAVPHAVASLRTILAAWRAECGTHAAHQDNLHVCVASHANARG